MQGAASAVHATALLAGASGLVGSALARQWPGPGTLHRLVRRLPAGAAAGADGGHPVVVIDYGRLLAASTAGTPLPPAVEAYCCLGTTIASAGSQAAFRAVDFDAVLAFARAAQAAGVTRFGVVSSLGASAGARGFYSRVKGEMEDALQALGFRSLVIARPSLLVGDRAALGQPVRTGERLALAVTAPLRPLLPAAWRPIEADVVARALLRAVGEAQPGVRVLSSAPLQSLGAAP